MSSGRRRWLWIAIVAVLAAGWWLMPRGTSPSQAPAVVESPDAPTASEIPLPEEPTPNADEEEPIAMPLPRDEVELPDRHSMSDAGVVGDDPALLEQKRDRMLTVVLDRLKQDVIAAEETGEDERAAQLRVRIERLEQRRSELAEE